jgi:hypothetical protein
MKTAERLMKAVAVLETLEYCRAEAHRPFLGYKLEKKIISKELESIEISTELAELEAKRSE